MTVVLFISVAAMLGSLVLVLAALRARDEFMRGYVRTGMTLFFLGAAGLVPYLIAAGPVRSVTATLFTAAALWFLVQDVRLFRRRLRGS